MILKIFKFIGYTIGVLILSAFIFINTGLFDKFLASQIKEKVLFNTGLELNFSRFYVSFFKGKLEADDIKFGNVLTIDKARFEIKSLKLLFGKLDIETARVYGVHINIDKDFQVTSFKQNPSELQQSGFASIIVRDFRLENVSVSFSDKKGNVASFVSKDFLIQAGFDERTESFSGVVAFNNGKLVYNNKPYLLNIACYFDFEDNALKIKELSISSGGLNIKAKGKLAQKKTLFEIEGDVDFYRLLKIEELKSVVAKFRLKGNFDLLSGTLSVSDGKRKASGNLTIDIKNKKIKLNSFKGNFKEHKIIADAVVSLGEKLKIAFAATVKGRYLKNFHANVDIAKDKEWNYNARFYGVDCGDGVCSVKVISGKTPSLSTVKLNLPILKSNIENNSGWIELNLKDAKVFANGDFFKKGKYFNGLISVKKLKFEGIEFPLMDGKIEVFSKDKIKVRSLYVKALQGTALLKGEYFKGDLDFSGKLENFPFKTALFFLDKQTLDEVDIHGSVNGSVRIKGIYSDPSVNGSVTLLHTNIYGMYFQSAASDFKYEKERLSLKNAVLSSGEGFLKGGGFIDFKSGGINMDFSGKKIDLNYIPIEDMYAENSEGYVKIFGTLEDLKIDADFKIGSTVYTDLELGGGRLKLKMENGDIGLDFALNKGLKGNGLIKAGRYMDFNFSAKNFLIEQSDTKVFITSDFNMKGDVEDLTSLEGKGNLSSLYVELSNGLTLYSDKALYFMKGMNLTIPSLKFKSNKGNLLLDFQNTFVDLNMSELKSTLNIEGDCEIVNFFLKANDITGIDIKGKIKGNLDVYGVVYSPFYSGQVQYGGSVYLKDADYVLENSQLNASVDYNLITVNSFTCNIEKGNVAVSGTVLDKSVDLQIKITNIPVNMPGFYADAGGLLFLKSVGEIFVASGYLQLNNGIINEEQMINEEAEEGFLDSVFLDLNVNLEGVTYSNSEVNLFFGKSRLKMSGKASSPVLTGIQYLDRESYLIIGDTKFYLERGKLIFDNPIENDPYIDIVAFSDIRDYRVRCLIKGSSSLMNIKFVSDPPLGQNKILSLIFGGGLDTGVYDFFRTSQQANLSGVGAALALNTLLSSFNTKLKRTLRVDTFSISSQVFDVTRSPTPVLSFGKKLSSRLSFLFAQSLSGGENIMQFTYHMAGKKNVYIRNEIDGSTTLEFEIIK